MRINPEAAFRAIGAKHLTEVPLSQWDDGPVLFLKPMVGLQLLHTQKNQVWHEFWFLFLHILNGRMATLPQALPRSFRDMHFCFRESKFKTRASASFREVEFLTISLEVLPRSHRELPRKLFLGVAWKCVICICWWAGHSDNVFGCTGWRVKNTYYIKVIHLDFELLRWHIHVAF